jgi:hypothetical protein
MVPEIVKEIYIPAGQSWRANHNAMKTQIKRYWLDNCSSLQNGLILASGPRATLPALEPDD